VVAAQPKNNSMPAVGRLGYAARSLIFAPALLGSRVASALRADAAPVADEEGAAEQVGPDFDAVVAKLVALGADAHKRGGFRERGSWMGIGRAGGLERRLGMVSREVQRRGCPGDSGNGGAAREQGRG
jgi:hypothetical protein